MTPHERDLPFGAPCRQIDGKCGCVVHERSMLMLVHAPGSPVTARRTIPRVTPRSPHNARAWFLGAVAAHLAATGIDIDASLIAMNELLENVVEHVGGPAVVEISAIGDRVRLACADRSTTLIDPESVPDEVDFEAEKGRGLAICKQASVDGLHVQQRRGGGQWVSITLATKEN